MTIAIDAASKRLFRILEILHPGHEADALSFIDSIRELIDAKLDSSTRREGGSDGEPTVEEWEALETCVSLQNGYQPNPRLAREALRRLRTAGRGKDSELSARIIPYAGHEWAAEFRQGERTARLEYEAGEPTVLTCNVPGGPSYIEFRDAALALRRAYEWLVGNHAPTAPESEIVADGQGEEEQADKPGDETGAALALFWERARHHSDPEWGDLSPLRQNDIRSAYRFARASVVAENAELREKLADAETREHENGAKMVQALDERDEARRLYEKAESARDEAERKAGLLATVVRDCLHAVNAYQTAPMTDDVKSAQRCADAVSRALLTRIESLRPLTEDPIPSKGGGK